MNRKRSKRISKQSKRLQLEWLRSLVDEVEAKKITEDNMEELLPEQKHVWGQGQMRLSFYTNKWLNKKIKQLIKIFPHKDIEDITSEDIVWKMSKR
jgi:hypothetical protein